jgi:glycosyltransferase involved in cell wall biosynthesis
VTEREKPLFAWYSNTYLYRSEIFVHRQLRGMHNAEVHVLAQWTTNLEEFPVESLYSAESARSYAGRITNALLRRLWPGRNCYTLPRYALLRLADRMRALSPDLAYCMFGWNASQLLDVLEAAGCHDTPLVFHAGGSDINGADSLGPGYMARLHQAFDRAAVILCVSEFLMSRVLQVGAPGNKVRLHYIGIDIPPDGQSSDPKDGGPFRILAVSRLSPVKGVRHTISAFAKAAKEMPRAILEIIGDGEDMKSCQDLARQLNISDRIYFHGSQPITLVYAAMRRADLFVQHNVRTPQGQEEGFGQSLIEAAAHGLPVVGTRSGGVPEAVVHGETGLLVEPGDETAMADAILELYRNPELRSRYGQAGRERVRRLFDLEKQNQKLERMLLEACGRRAAAASGAALSVR